MNFNLISPSGNGHTFNVRFDEPIVIPENASVAMNWSTFERDAKFEFLVDQTITLNVVDILPYFDYYNNGNGQVDGEWRRNGLERNAGDLSFTVKKGIYSSTELQNTISEAIVTLCGGATNSRGTIDINNAITPSNNSLQMINFSAVVPEEDPSQNYLSLGFSNDYPVENIAIHPTHRKDVAIFQENGVNTAYLNSTVAPGTAYGVSGSDPDAKVPVAGSWTSYTLGAKRYIHAGGQFNQYKGDFAKVLTGFDELEYVNTMILKIKNSFADLSRNIFFGLYGEPYAGMEDGGVTHTTAGVADGARIQTNNLFTVEEVTENCFVPACYFGIMVCGSDAEDDQHHLKIYVSNANAQSQAITGMLLVGDLDLQSYINPHSPKFPQIGLQTYYDVGNVAGTVHRHQRGTLHIRIFLTDNAGGKKIIFDTNSQNPTVDNLEADSVFTSGFMREFNTEAVQQGDNIARASASIPFSPILCFSGNQEQAYIQYSTYTASNANKTQSNLNEYSFTLSNELGKLFRDVDATFTSGVKNSSLISYSGAIADLFATYSLNYTQISMNENKYWLRNPQIIPQFASEKLSIYLTDLPIKSYKNTKDKSKSGYRKAILANIPQPFSGEGFDGREKIIGGYAPSIGVVNRLSNQSMTTNNFNVEIRNLETDEPARLITKSILNFTISAE